MARIKKQKELFVVCLPSYDKYDRFLNNLEYEDYLKKTGDLEKKIKSKNRDKKMLISDSKAGKTDEKDST